MRRALAFLPLLLLVAGCGSDPSSFEGSGEALKDASTSRVEMRLEGKDVPSWGAFRAAGTIDYANYRGDLAFEGKSDSASQGRIVFVGRDAYIGAKIGDATYWVKSSGPSNRPADRFLPGASGMSPDHLVNDLIEASKNVEKVGSEEIRNVTTTHYRAHLDKSKLENDSTAEVPDAVDVWVDQDGLPRRVRVPFGAGDEASAEVVDLFDFGVPVDVEAPAASEIVSEDKFSKLMETECAKVKSAKDLEDANPLCLIFGTILESSGSDSVQVSPTEGK